MLASRKGRLEEGSEEKQRTGRSNDSGGNEADDFPPLLHTPGPHPTHDY